MTLSLEAAFVVGVVCVIVEAFFSGSEIAMVSCNRALLRQRSAAGDSGARLAESFLARPQVLLATTLLGTASATITFAVLVELSMSELANSELFAIAMVTPLTLLFGEVVPKTLFQQYADWLVTRIVYPLRFASVVLRPLVWIFSSYASLVTRIMGGDDKKAFITRDELALLIESEPSTDKPAISEDEREMIANVFELAEYTVVEVMVPLSEVTALPEDTTLGEAALEVADKQHSRMPVYRSRVDDIVGIVHCFDLLRAGPEAKSKTVAEVARPTRYVPENMKAIDLLVDLQADGDHVAIVVDEYGGAVGIVTVEDLLEMIVGDIEDEYDSEPSPIKAERPGVWRVEARTPIHRLNKELELELPESDDYETIAGLMLEHFRRIPEPNETFTVGGVVIRVVAASDRAIEAVQLQRQRKK
jgi:CBS domain containing-hemolysin-like protein